VVRPLPDGVRLSVRCQVFGQQVRGTVRSTTLWDRLGNGSFVADGFLRWSPRRPAVPWCAGSARAVAQVSTSGGRLVVRAGPRSRARPVGSLPNRFRLPVVCQAWGTRMVGTVRTTTIWYGIGGNRYLTSAFVRWYPAVPLLPYCGQAGASVPSGSPSAFVGRVAPAARITRRRYGVPASVTIAQAILESGWGRSMLTRRDHNYFGIKCFGGPGPLAVGCRRYATSECGRDGCHRTSAQFRVYRAPSASLADHAYFLRSRARYRPAFRWTRDPDRFAREIHRAGYATSPTYATTLIRIMRKYGLYRYDR
jgi:flagellar protein FlgJ